jgi:hypothetical protein
VTDQDRVHIWRPTGSAEVERRDHRQKADLSPHALVVEPGGVKTPMWAMSVDGAERLGHGAPPELEARYDKLFDAMVSYSEKLANTGIEADVVSSTIGKALTARRPRTRYLIGRDAKLRGSLAGILPDRLMDRMILRTLSA